MSKTDPLPTSTITTTATGSSGAVGMLPAYRIGDLVWCQEARNNKLWWPAMITYDPHLGIFFRTVKQKYQQYHVQYFGISAIRGWVAAKSCLALNSVEEKPVNEKSLSKKVKAEYEVAIQEVAEAAKLDYKQRKLKFIFSFGPPKKGKGQKSKQTQSIKEPTDYLAKVKMEEVDSDSQSRPSRPDSDTVDSEVEGSAKSRPGADTALHRKAEGRSRRSSGVKNALSAKSDQKSADSESGNDASLPKEASRRRSRNGQWVPSSKRGKRVSATVPSPLASASPVPPIPPPPPTLHSQHPDKRQTRRRASESGPLDCDQCVQYITKSENVVELKCTSKPEVLSDTSIPAVGGEPIVMYVQKQYADKRKEGGDKIDASNLSHNLLAKETATGSKGKRRTVKKPFHLASHLMELPASSSSSKASSSSPSPVFPINLSVPSNGSVSSESEHEAGENGHFQFPASRKRKRRTASTGGAAPVSTLLTEVHSKVASDDEVVKKKRKRGGGPSASLLNLDEEMDSSNPASSSEKEGEGEGCKRTKRAKAGNSQVASGSIRGTQRTRKNSALLSNLSADTAASSATESCSDILSARLAVATPPCSSSDTEYAPSLDLESDVPMATTSSSSRRQPKERRKSKQLEPANSELQLSVCSICDCMDSNLLSCTGHCMNSFHLDCLGLVGEPDFKFVCDECLVSSGICFLCGKAHGEVRKCSRPKCTKLYHLECAQSNKLFQFSKNSSFICPLHVCARCFSIGLSTVNHSNLLQCIKCPLALHKPDCLVAGCEVLDNSRMLCYQHIKITKNTNLYSHINLNTCLECGSIGSLYCCDVCSAAYHMECLDVDSRLSVEGSSHWKCPSCAVHDLPTYGSLVITKFGVWRWWPSEVVRPEDVPDNILSKKPGDCMFVVRFCGSRDFCWTYHGRVVPYTEEAELEGMRGHKKPKASDNFKKALEEAREINKTRKKALEAKEAARQNSKFYTKIKTNKYLVPRPPLDLESPDFLPCQCTPESPCKEDSTCVNRAIHIECNPKNCPAGELCQNQRMQKCQNAKTEPIFTGNRGWGLKATADLSIGDFVIEYVGEVLDEEMCRERLKKAHTQNNNNFYMLTLDSGLVIDAGRKSNHARFINHSCLPNCETQKWRVRGEPRIGIFARQNIPAGSELTFDYQLDSLGNEKKKCFCGSKNCSGFLGVRSTKVTSEEEMKAKLKVKKKKKVKPRVPVKKEGEMEDRHDDDCFICKDGGELLLCDRKSCCRAYHLECINRKVFPSKSKKWDCPWHFCSKCQKPALSFCATCPVSFCSKHLQDNLTKRQDGTHLFCKTCMELNLKPSDIRPKGSVPKPTPISITDTTLLRKKSPQAIHPGNWTKPVQLSGSVLSVSQLLHDGTPGSASSIAVGRLRSPLSPDADSERSLVISRQSSGSLPPGLESLSASWRARKSPAASLKSSAGSIKSPGSSHKSPAAMAAPVKSPVGSMKSPVGSVRSPTGSVKSSIESIQSPAELRIVRSPSVDPAHIGTSSNQQQQEQQQQGQEQQQQQQQKQQQQQQVAPTTDSSALQVAEPHFHPLPSSSSRAPQPAPTVPRTPEAPMQVASPSHTPAVRTSLNRTPLFQPQSPTFGQNYSVPVPEAHSAKLPENYNMDFGVQRAAASFQQPQQASPMCNSFINPVWFMPRNGLMNSLDATGTMGTGGFHSYPSYPSALLNHGTLGFPYPTGYFGDPLATASATAAAANLESFGHHLPPLGGGGGGTGGVVPSSHLHQLPTSSISSTPTSLQNTPTYQPVSGTTAAFQPTSTAFPTVFPPTHPQNGFLWKYGAL